MRSLRWRPLPVRGGLLLAVLMLCGARADAESVRLPEPDLVGDMTLEQALY